MVNVAPASTAGRHHRDIEGRKTESAVERFIASASFQLQPSDLSLAATSARVIFRFGFLETA